MNFHLLILLLSLILSLPGASTDASAESMPEPIREAVKRGRFVPLRAPRPEREPLVRLGQALFMDPELSGNRDISCLHCHHPRLGTADGLPFAVGTGGRGVGPSRRQERGAQLTRRSTPPLFNLGENPQASLFWDGRVQFSARSHSFSTPEPALNGYFPHHPERRHPIARALDSSLAAQALFPMVSHEEMRGAPGSNEIADARDNLEAWARIMDRLGAKAKYRELFADAFPDAPSFESLNIGHAGTALAAFQRQAFVAVDTPYDRYLKGDDRALTPAQLRGATLFASKARCVECHAGPSLTGFAFFNVATPSYLPAGMREDLGRVEVPGIDPWERDKYVFAFRAPPLRNVALTAPYMHNGAFTSLREVVEHYNDPRRSLARYRPPREPSGFQTRLLHDNRSDAEKLRRIDSRLQDPLGLSEDEIDDLVEFLEVGLTDPSWVNSRQRAGSR